MSVIRLVQREHARWQDEIFPDWEAWECVVGAMEELGELSHSFLKRHQGLRKDQDHDDGIRDAIGDICLYLMGVCNREGLDFQNTIEAAWGQVQRRTRKNYSDRD